MLTLNLPAPPLSYVYLATISRVHDGDTLFVDIDLGFHCGARSVALRLFGYDSRELGGAGKFGGIADREALMELCRVGAEVMIQGLRTIRQTESRSFTRYVARVWADGVDVNAAMSARMERIAGGAEA